MSDYLRFMIESDEHHNIKVLHQHRGCRSAWATGGSSDSRCATTPAARRAPCRAGALFVLIGARPRTDWLPADIEVDQRGYVKTGPDAIEAKMDRRLPIPRGSFLPAARDVRAGCVRDRRPAAQRRQAGRVRRRRGLGGGAPGAGVSVLPGSTGVIPRSVRSAARRQLAPEDALDRTHAVGPVDLRPVAAPCHPTTRSSCLVSREENESLPALPYSRSLPEPPTRRSLPLCPDRRSLPPAAVEAVPSPAAADAVVAGASADHVVGAQAADHVVAVEPADHVPLPRPVEPVVLVGAADRAGPQHGRLLRQRRRRREARAPGRDTCRNLTR